LRIFRYLPGERGVSSSVKKFKDLLKPGESVFERPEAHAALLASATTSRGAALGAANTDHLKVYAVARPAARSARLALGMSIICGMRTTSAD
jgi:hypothetical protein